MFGGALFVGFKSLYDILTTPTYINACTPIEDKAEATLHTVASKKTFRRKSFENHHIVAQNAKKAAPARDIVIKLYGSVNTDENLVQLSYSFHRSLHTTLYYDAVNHYICMAYYSAHGDENTQKERVSVALNILRIFLTTQDILSM